MTLELTQEKRDSISTLLEKFKTGNSCSIEDFASMLGKLSAACPATPYGKLYTKSLERAKMLALRTNNDYKSQMSLTNDIEPDLDWWRQNIPTAVRSLEEKSMTMIIFTDASKKG